MARTVVRGTRSLPRRLAGDFRGALAAVPIALTAAIGSGTMAFSTLGEEFIAVGILTGLWSAVIAVAVSALVSRQPVQQTIPHLGVAAILSTLIPPLMAQPMLADGVATNGVGALIPVLFLTTLLAAILQLMIGVLKLAQFVKFIPYPVVAGFLLGAAALITTKQAPIALGIEGFQAGWQDLMHGDLPSPGPVLIASITLLVALFSGRLPVKFPIPGPLLGLIVGTGLYQGLLYMQGEAWAGPAITGFVGGFPDLHVGTFGPALLELDGLPDLLATVVTTSATIALVGTLLSLINGAGVDAQVAANTDGNRLVVGQGAGNLVSSLAGALPGCSVYAVSLAAWRAGATTSASSLFRAGLFALLALFGSPLIDLIPLSAVAGVLLVVALSLIDTWVRQIVGHLVDVSRWRRERAHQIDALINLLIAIAVGVLLISVGVLSALITGLLLAFIGFLRQAAGTVVRRTYTLAQVQSKTARPERENALIRAGGDQVTLLELQGPIFFGTADALAQAISATPENTTGIVLNLRRVSTIDTSGQMMLRRMVTLQARNNCSIAICHAQPPWRLEELFGMSELSDWVRFHDDVDAALAEFEGRLLHAAQSGRGGNPETTLRQLEVFDDFEADELLLLADYLAYESYHRGDVILADGEAGDRLLVLGAGSVSVQKRLGREGRRVRLASFRPGVVFGEMALLARQPRSADVIADSETICFSLAIEDFQTLQQSHPTVAVKLLLAIGRMLSQRLGRVSSMVAELER